MKRWILMLVAVGLIVPLAAGAAAYKDAKDALDQKNLRMALLKVFEAALSEKEGSKAEVYELMEQAIRQAISYFPTNPDYRDLILKQYEGLTPLAKNRVEQRASLKQALEAVQQSGTPAKKKTESAEGIPDWFQNIPSDPNFFYAVASATSGQMSIAGEKCKTDARAEIARQTRVHVGTYQKKFDEETGFGKDTKLLSQFTQVTETVASASLTGSTAKKQQVVKEGEGFRIYLLMEYPLGAANRILVEQIEASKEMYTRFRATQAFKELQEKVKEFEEREKPPAPAPAAQPAGEAKPAPEQPK